jgi:hypothetical protein
MVAMPSRPSREQVLGTVLFKAEWHHIPSQKGFAPVAAGGTDIRAVPNLMLMVLRLGCRIPAVFRVRVSFCFTRNLRPGRTPHKHHFRAPNSRASPFPSSTYIPGTRRSNEYQTRNNLTSYQNRGIIWAGFLSPALFPPPGSFLLHSPDPAPSPLPSVTHSNARNRIPFIGLFNDSLDAPGVPPAPSITPNLRTIMEQQTQSTASPKSKVPRGSQRCQARNRDRSQCRLPAQDPSTGLCSRHAALTSKYAATIDDSTDLCLDLFDTEIGGLDSTQGINTVLTNVVILLAKGRLSPRRASVITFALSLVLRSVVVMDREAANAPTQFILDEPRPISDPVEPVSNPPDHAEAHAQAHPQTSYDAAENYARLRT